MPHRGQQGQNALLQQGVYLLNIPRRSAAIPPMGPRLKQEMRQIPAVITQGTGVQAA